MVVNSVVVRKRQDGRYEARMDLGSIGGKRVRRSVYAKTKREAMAKALALQDKPVDSTMPLGDFLNDWIAALNLRPKTVEGYASVVRCHLLPGLGHIRLRDLTPVHVQRWVNGMGGSPRSIQERHTILRRACRHAIAMGLIQHNPAQGVIIPRQERYEGHPLTNDEVRRLMDDTRGTRWHALYALALFCGLRRSEFLGLRWSDVGEDTLRVNQTLIRTKGTLTYDTTKTRSSNRTVPIPLAARVALQEHRQWSGDGLVLVSVTGTNIEPGNVNRDWYKRRARLGINPCSRLHDLRHTYATVLLNNGVEVAVISRLLGHSTVDITMRVYAHVQRPMRDLTAGVFDALFPHSHEDQDHHKGNKP